jgi:hypothetical protein
VRGSSELTASGRHLCLAAFPFGSPLLMHLMSERARILPFNSSAFVGRAPLMAVPQTGDRLLPVLARIGAGLKIGFPSCTPCSCSSAFCYRTRVRPALSRHSRARTCVPALLAPPVLRPLSACTPARCVPLAPARAATSRSTSSRTPPRARSRRTCAAPALTSPCFNATEPPPRRLARPPEAARAVGSRTHPSLAPPAPPAHALLHPRATARSNTCSCPRAFPTLALPRACHARSPELHHLLPLAPCLLLFPAPASACAWARHPALPARLAAAARAPAPTAARAARLLRRVEPLLAAPTCTPPASG